MYSGTVIDIAPPIFDATPLVTSANMIYFSSGQSFRVSVVGLKPYTQHAFIIDNIDETSGCQNIYGGGFVSDQYGALQFNYFYNLTQVPALSTFSAINQATGLATSAKIFSIGSTDGSSFATGAIGIKPYATNTTVVGIGSLGGGGAGRATVMHAT